MASFILFCFVSRLHQVSLLLRQQRCTKAHRPSFYGILLPSFDLKGLIRAAITTGSVNGRVVSQIASAVPKNCNPFLDSFFSLLMETDLSHFDKLFLNPKYIWCFIKNRSAGSNCKLVFQVLNKNHYLQCFATGRGHGSSQAQPFSHTSHPIWRAAPT